MKRMEVWGGALDLQEMELPEGGASLVGGIADGLYLDRGDHWQFVDRRCHEFVHDQKQHSDD